MALSAALIITGIAIGLLVIYAADVAVAMSSDSDNGFLPLDHMQRGIGLGGPALILPIIAFFISRKEPSKGLGIMIIISGILIIVGGVVVLANPAPAAESSDRDPVASTAMLFIPAIVQLALGGIKITKS
ncbi:hypothetical protein NKOR_04680 [Candidatus Nitrosopumilus koreensis AR1]|uniref:Uncharacterized protein n=1 Tax=Candidatus Nitrosopumilus koreensis AR1 TaxID=1229908 RepID=K0B6T0_9ARCH|nr:MULTISPECIES: hypothetical protein [Nitrosopumilus]AFS80822.1 hypothetical protein NKOR_04680 [Candidatus Nitrosopumilus koreensis AR1]